jgi:hypothetical protein
MGKGGGSGKSKNYFGDIAGLVGCGPLHGIIGVLYNEKLIWPAAEPWAAGTWASNSIVAHNGALWETPSSTSAEPPASPWVRFIRLRADESVAGQPTSYTVPGYGDMHVLWGTDNQALSGDVATVLAGHPPYRRQAGIVLRKFLFGLNVKTPGNAALLYTRVPEQTLITGTACDLDGDFQCNPWTFLAELLTHRVFGLGLPDSKFDAASWQAVADWAEDNSDLTYISPLLTRPVGLRSLVGELMTYCAGWLRWDSAALIEAGRWLVNEAAPSFTDATTLDFHDATGEIEWSADTNQELPTAAEVVFRDAAAAFKERQMAVPNALAALLSRRIKARRVQRTFVTRASQALAIAVQEDKLFGRRARRGALPVRAEKATTITPGENFQLTNDLLSQSLVARCVEKSHKAPPSGEVVIQWEEERGISGTPYTPTVAGRNPSGPPALDRPQNFQFLYLPTELNPTGLAYPFALVMGRTEGTVSRVEVRFKKDEGADAFQLLATVRQFAVAGVLDASAATGATTIDVEIDSDTPEADFDSVNVAQTDDEVNDDHLLLIICRLNSPTAFEVCSVSGLTAAGGGVYTVAVTRARRGTLAGGDGSHTWAAGEKAFLIYRDDLLAFTHARFATLLSGLDTATFRLTPGSAWRTGDPDDVYDAGTNPAGKTTETTLRFGLPDWEPTDWLPADWATT